MRNGAWKFASNFQHFIDFLEISQFPKIIYIKIVRQLVRHLEYFKGTNFRREIVSRGNKFVKIQR